MQTKLGYNLSREHDTDANIYTCIITDTFNVNIFQEYNSSPIALLNPYLVGFVEFIGEKKYRNDI